MRVHTGFLLGSAHLWPLVLATAAESEACMQALTHIASPRSLVGLGLGLAETERGGDDDLAPDTLPAVTSRASWMSSAREPDRPAASICLPNKLAASDDGQPSLAWSEPAEQLDNNSRSTRRLWRLLSRQIENLLSAFIGLGTGPASRCSGVLRRCSWRLARRRQIRLTNR